MSRRSSDISASPTGLADRPVAEVVDRTPAAEDELPASEGSAMPIPLQRPDTGPQDKRRSAAGASARGSTSAGAESDDDRFVALSERLRKLEVRNRLLILGLIGALVTAGIGVLDKLPGGGVVVQQNLMESKELTLVDADGNPRLFLRMFSRVPVLQVMDSTGKPRMSLGLRFDDTPFIDLSDANGTTRATLEMTETDSPALRLFDESGKIKFQIN